MTHRISTHRSMRPAALRAAWTLALLALATPLATAQFHTNFSAVSGFGDLNAAEQEVSSSLGVHGWSASQVSGFIGGGWVTDSSGTLSCTQQQMSGTVIAEKLSSGSSLLNSTRFITYIECTDLTFESETNQGGTVSVTLPAELVANTTEGDPGTGGDGLQLLRIKGDIITSPNDLLLTSTWNESHTPPNGTFDLSHTSNQPLDTNLSVEFSMTCLTVVSHDPDDGDYYILTNSATLTLGNPLTGELFVLPPGVTANAPSIGLVDNVFTTMPPAWQDLGNGLAGTGGLVPELSGTGVLIDDLEAGSHELSLTNALPSTTSTLVMGVSEINAPFKGGTMVPNPDFLVFGLPVDANGDSSIPFSWPGSIPAGTTFTVQHWVSDAGGPAGFSASNGLRGVAH